jgi:L-alanine-DL-glutamate epimerase-like enolase superfamily enzyme
MVRNGLLCAHCGDARGVRTFAHYPRRVHVNGIRLARGAASMTRIRRVQVYAVTLHHAAGPFTMSGGRVSTEQDSTVVRLETDDGLVGYGESCVISPDYAPGYAGSARAVLALLARAAIGHDPRQVELVAGVVDAAAKGYAYAKSALDMACWDLFGRATGMRVSDLLGGTHQEEFPLYNGVGVGDVETMRRGCADLLEQGYERVQIKVGTGWREDVDRIRACAEVLGGADMMIVDANAWWTQAEAARVVAAVEDLDLYLEQPCATLEECAQIRRSTRHPLILDESLSEVADIVRARAAGGVDALRLKLTRFGGITPIRRARDLAVAFGLPLTIEDSGGGDVVTAAVAHLAASIPPKLLLAGYLPSEMSAERIASGTPVAARGRARLPEAPGLGIEVDEGVLGEPLLTIE